MDQVSPGVFDGIKWEQIDWEFGFVSKGPYLW